MMKKMLLVIEDVIRNGKLLVYKKFDSINLKIYKYKNQFFYIISKEDDILYISRIETPPIEIIIPKEVKL